MRVLIDTLGAPAKSGGMRHYAENLIAAWFEAYPADELIVLGDRTWSTRIPQSVLVTWPNGSVLARFTGQVFAASCIFWWRRADALLSVSPIVSPVVPRRRRVCVVHDWRHTKNPHEFGRAQRWYRALWKASVRTAGHVVAISTKTAIETRALVPRARVSIVENGRDSVRFWPPAPATQQGKRRLLVTFGHQSNKRPELAIDALARLEQTAHDWEAELVVLGAEGTYRAELADRARRMGVSHLCRFPGFVGDEEYRALMRAAAAVLLISSDEGFGLPLTEASLLGIPSVVTGDSGLHELHAGGHVVCDPDPTSLSHAIVQALQGEYERADLDNLHSWRDAATAIRAIAEGASN